MALVEKASYGDTEELSHALSHAKVSAMQLDRGRFQATLTRYSIEDWSFQHIAFDAGVSSCLGDSPSGRSAVVVPLESTSQRALLGRPVSATTIALYGGGSEHADVTSAGARTMVIVLPEPFVSLPKGKSQVIEVEPAAAGALKSLLTSIQRTAENRPDQLGNRTITASIDDALKHVLAAGVSTSTARAHAGRPEIPRAAVVSRIREILNANSGEPIFSNELSEAAGVSMPTLRRTFLDWYGMPPASYLLLRRFHLARRRLRSGQSTTVRDAAESCGFWDLSRFSSSYREVFGELPSQTLALRPR